MRGRESPRNQINLGDLVKDICFHEGFTCYEINKIWETSLHKVVDIRTESKINGDLLSLAWRRQAWRLLFAAARLGLPFFAMQHHQHAHP